MRDQYIYSQERVGLINNSYTHTPYHLRAKEFIYIFLTLFLHVLVWIKTNLQLSMILLDTTRRGYLQVSRTKRRRLTQEPVCRLWSYWPSQYRHLRFTIGSRSRQIETPDNGPSIISVSLYITNRYDRAPWTNRSASKDEVTRFLWRAPYRKKWERHMYRDISLKIDYPHQRLKRVSLCYLPSKRNT